MKPAQGVFQDVANLMANDKANGKEALQHYNQQIGRVMLEHFWLKLEEAEYRAGKCTLNEYWRAWFKEQPTEKVFEHLARNGMRVVYDPAWTVEAICEDLKP